MLKYIKFLKDFRCFKAGDQIDFRPGINLIVGDQGTGKSSMFKMLIDFIMGGDLKLKSVKEEAQKTCDVACTSMCSIMAFDHEKQNPRTLAYFTENIGSQIQAMFSSHGQTVKAINQSISETRKEVPIVFIMDEPDNALCIKSIYELMYSLHKSVANGNQVIMIVHNPILIANQKEVFDMGKKKWTTSKAFIKSMTPKKSDLHSTTKEEPLPEE